MRGGILKYISCISLTVLVQVAVVRAQTVPPSSEAGRVPQRFETPTQPKSLPRSEGIQLPSTVTPENAGAIALTVSRFDITGSSVFTATDFADLTKPLIGKQIALAEVYALAARITARYGEAGYVLSRTIVPPQSLPYRGAVVRLEVVEGYVDEVVWPDGLKQRYRDFFSDYENRILASRPVDIKVIERYLLLAGDLPGLTFSSTFRPSKTHTKASTLLVSVSEKPLAAEVSLDNRGSQGRGPWQGQTAVTENNALGLHEAVSLKYAMAVPATEQLRFIEGNWRQVLNAEGLTLTLSASYNSGIPGLSVLRAIDYDSDGLLFSAALAYPVIRTREENLTLSGIGFSEDVKSHALSSPFTDDRLRGLRARLDYDRADRLAGINQLQLTLSQGIDGLGSSGNDNTLASRAGGHVEFTKLEGLVSRTQPLNMLTPGLSAYAALYGQHAWQPLLSPEQCSYGGASFGRAFDPSALTGDHCVSSLIELRYDLVIPDNIFSRSQLYSFIDHGYVERLTASAGTPDDQWGSSAGAGLRLGWRDNVSLGVEAGKGIGGEIDNDWHGHVELTLRY